MKTPKLDEQIRKLQIFAERDNLNQHEKDTLSELLKIKLIVNVKT